MSKFSVWERDNEAEAREIEAEAVVDAAEKFCTEYDEDGEYAIARRGTADIVVADSEGTHHSVFVEVETVAHYSGKVIRRTNQ